VKYSLFDPFKFPDFIGFIGPNGFIGVKAAWRTGCEPFVNCHDWRGLIRRFQRNCEDTGEGIDYSVAELASVNLNRVADLLTPGRCGIFDECKHKFRLV
jgi:hypothetical protein